MPPFRTRLASGDTRPVDDAVVRELCAGVMDPAKKTPEKPGDGKNGFAFFLA